MPYLSYTVGLGLWGQMRRFLREAQFRHDEIRWLESSGWIERTFTIKAEPAVLAGIKRDLDRWVSELERASAMGQEGRDDG